MPSVMDSPKVQDKVRELCEAILDDPAYRSLMEQVDAFLEDEDAREQYRRTTEMGHGLQTRHQGGDSPGDAEIVAFEKEREELLGNDRVREFLDAQQELGAFHARVNRWVEKTLELGRLPEESEVEDEGGCCGGGCGCSH